MTAQYGVTETVPYAAFTERMRSITPTALPTGTTENYAPDDAVTLLAFYEAQIIRQETHPSGSSIGGLVTSSIRDGQFLFIKNLGPGTLTLLHASSGTTDAYRFSFPDATNVTLVPDASVMVIYDGTSGEWNLGPGSLASIPAGSIGTAELEDKAVTLGKMADLATDRLLGRDTAGTGSPEALTVGGGVEFTGTGGIQRSALTGDVTAAAGSGTTTISNDAVTLAKLANVATARILGRTTAGTGDPEALTGTQATTLLDAFTATLKGVVPAPGGSPAGANALLDNGTWGAVQSLFYDVTNPAYGAVGDGVTDDRVAIQAAIDAANAAGGGVVWFPNGTYRVTRTSVGNEGALYLKGNVWLLGEARTGAIIKLADNQSSFTRVIRISSQADIRISNLTIDGNKAGTSVPEEHMAGIFPSDTTRLLVDHVTMQNCCGDGMQVFSGCADIKVSWCRATGNDRSGIAVTGTGMNRLTIEDCQLDDNADQQVDTELSGAGVIYDVAVVRCHLTQRTGVGGYAITCSGYSVTDQAVGFLVEGCVIEGAIYCYNATKIRIVNNRINVPNDGTAVNALNFDRKCVDCTVANNHITAYMANSTAPAVIYLQGLATGTDEKPADIRIENNYLETDQNASGVLMNSAISAMVVNNRIVGNSSVASTRCGVTALFSEGGASYQMRTLIVRGNWITDFGTGIIVSPASGTDTDHDIKELQVCNNVLERVSHASMIGMELNRSDDRIASAATVFGNVTINITTVMSTSTGWPYVATLIAGNRGYCGVYTGTSSPEGVLTEKPGAIYIARDGLMGAVVYRKELGTGSTGWIAQDDGNKPNLVRNSGFLLAQRQAPGTLTTYSSLAGRAIGADGWGVTNANASVQYQRTDTIGAAESGLVARYYGTFSKITTLGKIIVSQVIEGQRTAPVCGKKLWLSLKLKSSISRTMCVSLAYLSSAGTVDTIPGTFISATGADGVDPTLGTNLAYITPGSGLVENCTISGSKLSCSTTTAWQRFAGVFTIPANAKNLVVLVWSSDSVAVADTFSMSEVVLGEGAITWRAPAVTDELEYAQRFYQKTFSVDAAPAQNAGTSTGELVSALWKAAATASAAVIPWRFQTEMRAAPAITTFNPAAANAEVRQTGGTASDLTASAAGETTTTQTVITATGVGTGAVGDRTAVHATADAEL